MMIRRNAEDETTSDHSHERIRRAALVRLLRERGLKDRRVLRAMARVPRELFVREEDQGQAYDDCPLAIGFGQTISQPYIVAVMIEALGVGPGDRVLDVGAGSGYTAALLSEIGTQVHALERIPELADRARTALARAGASRVSILCRDGNLGLAAAGPFDAILVSAAGADVPNALLEQLKIGGRLVAPVGGRDSRQMLIRILRRSERDYEREEICPVHFVPLIAGVGERVR